MAKDENLLTIKDFALKTHYSKRQIRQMCIDGKVKAQKIGDKGRKWLIPESEIHKITQEPFESTEEASQMVQDYSTPTISKYMEKHFGYLVEIITVLLDYGLDTVYIKTDQNGNNVYVRQNQEISGQEFMEIFSHNLERAMKRFGESGVSNLALHVMSEYPEIDFLERDFSKVNHFALIEALKTLSQKRRFKGKCPDCPD